ncbi:hypothetical protein JCM19037_1337 [Geomicrobium sp. JCM 19037]|uniref:hypothetical protein n=1 Tax=Geomicrobium sp. JCM 19037 TaxID=1460634 RepID=UPI00045F3789|nr:hypothetical protein [Geomicrobium sp. JCM 19037]GAK03054.1 hypothetical protein JCM19037_1337 [Geomicrobium sp. JCM 19037]
MKKQLRRNSCGIVAIFTASLVLAGCSVDAELEEDTASAVEKLEVEEVEEEPVERTPEEHMDDALDVYDRLVTELYALAEEHNWIDPYLEGTLEPIDYDVLDEEIQPYFLDETYTDWVEVGRFEEAFAHGHQGLDRAEALIATDVHDVNEEELSVSYYTFGTGPVAPGKAILMFEAQDDAWVFAGYNYEEDLGSISVSLEEFENYIAKNHPMPKCLVSSKTRARQFSSP